MSVPKDVRKIYIRVKKSRDGECLFKNESLEVFAGLPANELAIYKKKLKRTLGDKLNLNDFTRAINQAKGGKFPENKLPSIIINKTQLPETTNLVLGALEKANVPPFLFNMGGSLVRLQFDETGYPIIKKLSVDSLRGDIARAACFYRETANGFKNCPPPVDIVRDILSLRALPFPRLDGVIQAPALRQDGSILSVPGYDPSTYLHYSPANELKVRKIPDNPNDDQLRKAIKLIKKLIRQFALPTKASRANTFALLLTPIIRPAISGSVPLAIIDAPIRGTGKTMLANTVSMIAIGREPNLFIPPQDEDEWRKKITTVLQEGASILLIDDVGTLDVRCLSTALTSSVWEDRILSHNKGVRVPHKAVWIATGNNISVKGDLQRRCYWIRMDAKTSEPWRRSDFAIEDLPKWIESRRGKLISALLTICRAWFAAGKLMAKVPTFGSFKAWSKTVGSILAFIGIQGFLGDLDKLRHKRDDESVEWEAFLNSWFELYKRAVTVHELCIVIKEGGPLRETLPGDLVEVLEDTNKSFERVLGKALAKKEAVRFGKEQLHLKRSGQRQRAIMWKVISINQQERPPQL